MNEITVLSTALDGTPEAAQLLRAAIIKRGHELAKEGEAIFEKVRPGEGALSIKEATDERKVFAARVEDLRDIGKILVKDAVERTHADIVLRQIDDRFLSFSSKPDPVTTYAQLADIAKRIKTVIDERKKAEEPAAPVRAIACVIYATDEAFRKLCADVKAGKRDGMELIACAPSEDAEKKAVKIITAEVKEK